MSAVKNLIVARLLYNNETYYLKQPDFEAQRGTLVVIDTNNGPEIAVVSGMSAVEKDEKDVGKILRICTDEDLAKQEENRKKEEDAYEITLEKIKKHGLDMKLVSIHYFLDDAKIIFNFTADGRVDFRELVKDLASVFKRRIELRQIGARDEAKIIKGCGVCGREFCCNAVKHELQPVTIKMAKDQNLTLNSSKISGACGRLLCCLAYEHDAYCEIKRVYPPEGSVFTYDNKKVCLAEINILKMTATLKTEDNISIVISLNELPAAKKEAPPNGAEKSTVVEEVQ